MNGRLPDFVIIGGMKCGTTTLHDQLALQPGFFMSTPKEPCFFSDDAVWNRGLAWYRSLFADAPAGAICGESSTHYTKLPTYPQTLPRLRRTLPNARLVYIVRDPVERIVSQYVHEWSRGEIRAPLADALRSTPRLIEYSRYAMQLRPYADAFGPDRILVIFFERMVAAPQEQLDRVGRFLGSPRPLLWLEEAEMKNASHERLRLGPAARALLYPRPLTTLRRALVPKALRERVKSRLRATDRPSLTDADRRYIREQLDADIELFGDMLGLPLRCDGFGDTAAATASPALVSSAAARTGRGTRAEAAA